MVTIKNDRVTAEISEIGAEMRRLTVDGNDVLWSGDPEIWKGIAPLMFPICGGLRDDKFVLDGKEYTLQKHGYARFQEFTVEKQGDRFVTLMHRDNDETYRQFPWHYELRVTYALHGTALDITYSLKNLSDNTMYFSIGSHEGYACPGGIEDYDVIFPQKETLESWVLDGNLLAHKTLPIIKESDRIALYDKFFEVDALVFKDLKSRSATLRNRKTGRSVTVDFPGCNYFLLWHKYGADYICMEPWGGVPGMVDDGYDITEKEGIETLSAGGEMKRTHTIHL